MVASATCSADAVVSVVVSVEADGADAQAETATTNRAATGLIEAHRTNPSCHQQTIDASVEAVKASSESRRTVRWQARTFVDMDTDYRLKPIESDAADRRRALGGERYIADAKPGYPCRQCLSDAEVGEALILVAHDPFATESPYRSRSPIFLHEHACSPPTDLTALPAQLTGRQLSVRAFDRDEMMLDAEVIDGTDLDGTLRRFFGDLATAEVHIHNATRGCWATSVSRST